MDQCRTFPHYADTLCGAGAIAEYLFGSRSDRRRVYYFVEKRRDSGVPRRCHSLRAKIDASGLGGGAGAP